MNIIKKLCADQKLRWTNHIFLRLVQRNISMGDVQTAICNGEIIEDYPDDLPYPSCLILGFRDGAEAIHVVCAPNDELTELWLITAYIPNRQKWMDDFKTRKVE